MPSCTVGFRKDTKRVNTPTAESLLYRHHQYVVVEGFKLGACKIPEVLLVALLVAINIDRKTRLKNALVSNFLHLPGSRTIFSLIGGLRGSNLIEGLGRFQSHQRRSKEEEGFNRHQSGKIITFFGEY